MFISVNGNFSLAFKTAYTGRISIKFYNIMLHVYNIRPLTYHFAKWALNYTTILHNLDTYKMKQASWSGNVKNEIESDVWVLTEWVCSKCLRELLWHSGSNSFTSRTFYEQNILFQVFLKHIWDIYILNQNKSLVKTSSQD